MLFNVNCCVTLIPVWHKDPPEIMIGVNDDLKPATLEFDRNFVFDYQSQGLQKLQIKLLNKTDSDTVLDQGLDKAVIVKQISFFGIRDQKFIWKSQYRPQYSLLWYQQQCELGQQPQEILTSTDRLSWNGEWWLEFDLPVFTWIHRVQDLGWIYH